MAKKTAGTSANGTQSASGAGGKKPVKGVRLDLEPKDHRRLFKLAKERGITMSAYCRLAVFERMLSDEAKS